MNDNNDNVVTFGGNPKLQQGEGEGGNKPEPVEERLILVCNRCNCRTWNLMGHGDIECANCSNVLSVDTRDDPAEKNWRRIVSDRPTDPETIAALGDDGGTINDISTGDVNFARARVFRNIEKMYKTNTACILIGYSEDGASTSWFNIETEEQKQWTIRKMEELLEHMRETEA